MAIHTAPTALLHHPAIAHYLRFISTVLGRDKVLRLVQYLARFYAAFLTRRIGLLGFLGPALLQATRATQQGGSSLAASSPMATAAAAAATSRIATLAPTPTASLPSPAATAAVSSAAHDLVPFLGALKTKLGFVRRVLRAGKNVEHLKAAAVAYDGFRGGGMDGVVRWCSVGRQLGYAGYLSADLVTLVRGDLGWGWGDVAVGEPVGQAGGAKRGPRAGSLMTAAEKALWWQKLAWRFWAMGIGFSVASGVYSLWDLRCQQRRVDKHDGEGAVVGKRIERERAQVNSQMLCDVCDLTIPLSALGVVPLDDTVVGLAGSISSAIGISNQWKKTA